MLTELLIGGGILAICLVIHITGMVVLGDQLVRRRQLIARRESNWHTAWLLMVIFAILILLHISESFIWAAFYVWYDLFQDHETALYFSLASYSTIGYGDVLLPHDWRLLGTIEGVSGVLLCGLSSAFLFTILNALFRFRVQRIRRQKLL